MANIPHYLRLKPQGDTPEEKLRESLIEDKTERTIRFRDTAAPNKFTKIFSEVSQLDLYKETLEDLTGELFEGKDSAFFTLGPSNSGKSHSIYGDDSNPGLSIYSLNEIFNKIEDNYASCRILKRHFGETLLITTNSNRDSAGEYGLSLSVFEIYNDRLRDLSLDTKKTQNQSMDIITDAKDGKIKPNKLRQIYVTNLEAAKTVIHKCIQRRAVGCTSLNQTSSRSHLFIYFNLHKVTGSVVRTTRLTIADLAGSERTKDAKTEGKEFKEGNYTNTSLTELGRCLSLMRSRKFDKSHLRTSKLTRLLLTDLIGNANTNRIKILLTLDPYSSLASVMHAVRYIQPISKAQISARSSMEVGDAEASELHDEVKSLKKQQNSLIAENKTMKQQLNTLHDQTVEAEMQTRSEVTGVYEEKIKELEMLHMQELNDLKDQHQAEVDTKLQLISEDYEARMKLLQKQMEEKVVTLRGQLAAADVEGLQAKNAEFQAEIALLREQLVEAEKENKRLEKKDKKKSKRIDELGEKLSESTKRTSVSLEPAFQDVEESSNKKVRFSDFDEKENDLKLSPIRLIRTSPNKHFKFDDVSSKKTLILQESNLPPKSPSKSPQKSPSKGKKKINRVALDDMDLA